MLVDVNEVGHLSTAVANSFIVKYFQSLLSKCAAAFNETLAKGEMLYELVAQLDD